jgi:hypothetical protein
LQQASGPGDDRSGRRPLFFFLSHGRQNRFHEKPVQKRVTYRDNLVLSLDFSRAAGDMGLETGLFFESGGTWQVEANEVEVDRGYGVIMVKRLEPCRK